MKIYWGKKFRMVTNEDGLPVDYDKTKDPYELIFCGHDGMGIRLAHDESLAPYEGGIASKESITKLRDFLTEYLKL